jgi:hypothetical protein
MACVFTEIFMMRMLNAKTQTAGTRKYVDEANPISAKAIAREVNPAKMGLRVLKRETSQLEIGRPAIELMGMNKSMVPNSASLKSKLVLMVGLLDAQVEKQNPERKKKALKYALCCDLVIIPS